MTLAELLNEDEVTSSAVVPEKETTPHYIPNAEIDKLASLIETFAEKYETTLEELNSMIDKTALFGKKTTTNSNPNATPTNAPPKKELGSTELENLIQNEANETKRLELVEKYETMRKRNQVVREGGGLLRRHPKAVAAIAGGLVGSALIHQYDKQKQLQNMGGA